MTILPNILTVGIIIDKNGWGNSSTKYFTTPVLIISYILYSFPSDKYERALYKNLKIITKILI